jgi:hypothetical protein
MVTVKWAAILVAVVTLALDALSNLLLATLTPHSVPEVVNLFALALAAVAAIFAFGLDLALRMQARFDLTIELMVRRFEELEARIGDRNSGFVEGYMLGRSPEMPVPEASVVPLVPRGPRRAHNGED